MVIITAIEFIKVKENELYYDFYREPISFPIQKAPTDASPIRYIQIIRELIKGTSIRYNNTKYVLGVSNEVS